MTNPQSTDNELAVEDDTFGLNPYDGYTLPLFQIYKTIDLKTHMDSVINFESRDTDILLCTFPKSGTHWLDQIIKMLMQGDANYGKGMKSETMMEVIPAAKLDSLPSPRILNTHVSFRHIPRKHVENGYKLVHVIRNPKDVCVSLYNHCSRCVDVLQDNFPGTWENFVNLFAADRIRLYNGWFRYEKEFQEAKANGKLQNVHTMFYEDLKKNPVKEIQKLAVYLGVECNNEMAESIADLCSFDNLTKLAHTSGAMKNIKKFSADGTDFIFRKGIVGDWKNWFTVAQNEMFDQAIDREMKSANLQFTYE